MINSIEYSPGDVVGQDVLYMFRTTEVMNIK